MTHVLQIIWDAEFNGDTNFHIGSKSGQDMVKKPNYKTLFSPAKHEYLTSSVSEFKNVIYDDIIQSEMLANTIKR